MASSLIIVNGDSMIAQVFCTDNSNRLLEDCRQRQRGGADRIEFRIEHLPFNLQSLEQDAQGVPLERPLKFIHKGLMPVQRRTETVSYTHLTLPTNREV